MEDKLLFLAFLRSEFSQKYFIYKYPGILKLLSAILSSLVGLN